MTRAQEIRDFIKTHPGCTSKDIAAELKLDEMRVAANLWAEVDKKKRKVIRREESHRSVTNTPVYKYFYDERPAPEIQRPAPMEAEAAVRPRRTKRPVATVTAETSFDDLFNQIADTMAAYVTSRFRDQLADSLSHLQLPEAAHVSPKDIAARIARPIAPTKKPVVLVAGLLPMQAGKIQQAFNDVFDMKFFEVGGNLQQLRDMVANADFVFTFTSKIPHKVEEVIKSAGKPIHRCSGGLTMLEGLMLDLYVNLEEGANK